MTQTSSDTIICPLCGGEVTDKDHRDVTSDGDITHYRCMVAFIDRSLCMPKDHFINQKRKLHL